MTSEVKRVAFAKSEGKSKPITGQHVELTFQSVTDKDEDKANLKALLTLQLPNHMLPRRLKMYSVSLGHRYKRV